MDVRIDEKSDRDIGNLSDCRHDFLAQWSKLIVHHENAVGPHQDTDRAALAFERVEIAAKLGGLDLDLAEIGRRRRSCGRSSGLAIYIRQNQEQHCQPCWHHARGVALQLFSFLVAPYYLFPSPCDGRSISPVEKLV